MSLACLSLNSEPAADLQTSAPRGSRRRLCAASALAVLLLAGAPLGPASLSTARAASETETEIPCEGDACQPLPTPPEDPQPGTTAVGPANPAPHYTKPAKPRKGHHHHKHHGRRRSAGR